MDPGDVLTIPLTEFMADKAPLWELVVEREGLMHTPYADIAAWPFADYISGTRWDVMTDTLKIRMAGFNDYVRSQEMFIELFDEFRARKAIP